MIYVEDSTSELITERENGPQEGTFDLADIATQEIVRVRVVYVNKSDDVVRCEVLSEWRSRGVDA